MTSCKVPQSLEFALLERLAADVWSRLEHSQSLGCSQGEVTITDLNLLDMLRSNCRVQIVKAEGDDEAQFGYDWDWWLKVDSSGWWRFSVQAKKLHIASNRYKSLKHKPKKSTMHQIDTLISHSASIGAIPIYCFYNWVASGVKSQEWKCKQTLDVAQLGVTVLPAHIVKKHHDARGTKSFSDLHRRKEALPWRCLLCQASDGALRLKKLFPPNVALIPHKDLPDWLKRPHSDYNWRDESARGPEGFAPRYSIAIDASPI